jgi:hypothetical protein
MDKLWYLQTMNYSGLKRNEPLSQKTHGGTLKAFYKVKEATLKRLQTTYFQLYDILERQNNGNSKMISSCQRLRGGRNEW